tara:strand:+ start:698 stop:1354 length:657 start_codon:yes stop_codon:yes gene_type:complete
MLPNRLTFIKFSHIRKKLSKPSKRYPNGRWNKDEYSQYRCICGKVITTRTRSVDKGHTRSCGCLLAESRKKNLRPNFKKGHTLFESIPHPSVGRAPFNKGKIFIPDDPSKNRGWRGKGGKFTGGHYVTEERLTAMYNGLEGEVHSLKDQWDPDETEKWFLIDIDTVPERQKPVLKLLRKGWRQKEIAEYLELTDDIIYQWTHKWRHNGRVKWSEPKYA